MEAAIVMPCYIYFTLFLLQLTLYCLWQQVLDTALQAAAWQIQVGAAQSQASTGAAFVQGILCPNLVGLIDCSQVSVSTSAVGSFYDNAQYSVPRDKKGAIDPTKMPYCNSGPGQLMLVHAVYNAPITLWPLTSGGTAIISTAAFENEQFPAGGAGGGC